MYSITVISPKITGITKILHALCNSKLLHSILAGTVTTSASFEGKEFITQLYRPIVYIWQANMNE